MSNRYLISSILCFFAKYCITCTLGIENISDDVLKRMCGGNVALVAHQASKTKAGEHVLDVLRKKGVKITHILTPEHGFFGVYADDKKDEKAYVDSDIDAEIIPLYSGRHGGVLSIPSCVLKKINGVVLDMQDVGMRHYTHNATLLHIMKECAHARKWLVLLDRPNPLGGVVEGPLYHIKNTSLLSLPLPLRHGLTMGEVARYFNKYILKKPIDLVVVPLIGYSRTIVPDSCFSLPFSPGLRSMNAVRAYSFTGLLGEIRPFDTGGKTAYPYQRIGLSLDTPMSDEAWIKIENILKKFGVQSKPLTYYSERKKQKVRGLSLLVSHVEKIRTGELLYYLLRTFLEHGVPCSFSPSFNISFGDSCLADAIINHESLQKCANKYKKDVAEFEKKAQSIRLYSHTPGNIL